MPDAAKPPFAETLSADWANNPGTAIPEYKAVLFPSNSNTVEVFRLRVWTADPSPGLNKLFASNPEVLR